MQKKKVPELFVYSLNQLWGDSKMFLYNQLLGDDSKMLMIFWNEEKWN